MDPLAAPLRDWNEDFRIFRVVASFREKLATPVQANKKTLLFLVANASASYLYWWTDGPRFLILFSASVVVRYGLSGKEGIPSPDMASEMAKKRNEMYYTNRQAYYCYCWLLLRSFTRGTFGSVSSRLTRYSPLFLFVAQLISVFFFCFPFWADMKSCHQSFPCVPASKLERSSGVNPCSRTFLSDTCIRNPATPAVLPLPRLVVVV